MITRFFKFLFVSLALSSVLFFSGCLHTHASTKCCGSCGGSTGGDSKPAACCGSCSTSSPKSCCGGCSKSTSVSVPTSCGGCDPQSV